jgi:hypothetical protein
MERHMPKMKPIVRLMISVACVTVAAVVVHTQTLGTPEHFTAAAFNTNRGAAGNIDIQVDRWSSDAEREKLINTLTTKGADKLLDVLQDFPASSAGIFASRGITRPTKAANASCSPPIGRLAFSNRRTSRVRSTIRSRLSRCSSIATASAKAKCRSPRK